MLFITEKIAKLGGVYLGAFQKITIQESANIHTIQDDTGKITKTQPSGYDHAKITIDLILEDTKKEKTLDQMKNIQRLFRQYKQKSAKKLKIVNEDCAARGISKVYFKDMSSSKEVSQSKRLVTLELIAPDIAGIKVKKNSGSKKSSKDSKKDNKSKKSSSKSPAKDNKDTSAGKKKATTATKK